MEVFIAITGFSIALAGLMLLAVKHISESGRVWLIHSKDTDQNRQRLEFWSGIMGFGLLTAGAILVVISFSAL